LHDLVITVQYRRQTAVETAGLLVLMAQPVHIPSPDSQLPVFTNAFVDLVMSRVCSKISARFQPTSNIAL
jgi:hypothetical protein